MDFEGIIIEESLSDTSVLNEIKIISTKVEPVTEKHKTPWIKQWTLHKVIIPAVDASKVAIEISQALDKEHEWYADYKNTKEHFIIYRDKIFHISDRSDAVQYNEATKYGISIGIPEYQVDFSPHIKVWKR
jgi:hypothetical protein